MFSADLGVNQVVSYPPATDPPFQKVALLLHGDGTNGAQNNTFVDYSYPGGYAVSFDGSGDYLSTPSITIGSGDFTIECWAYQPSITSYPCLFTVGDSKLSTGIEFQIWSSHGQIYGNNSTIYYSTDSGWGTLTTWIHYAIVRSGSTLTVYRNGISLGTATYTQSISGVVRIGCEYYNSGVANYWTGYISNFRIATTALYTSNFTPSNQPLTAVSGTQLLTCQSATIVDNSPNAFTITVNGDAAAVSSKTITRTGNVAQGTFSPFSLAEGQWSNYFDGSGDYLYTATSAAFGVGTGDFTFECWINPANWTATTAPIFVVSTTGGLWIGKNGSNFVLRAYAVADQLTTTTFPATNTWTHLAVVRNGSTVTIYYNGVSIVSGTVTYNFVQAAANIGGDAAGSYFTGYISNARLVKGTAVYTANFTPSTTPLTAITNTSLLTCQSNRFKDNSSNNFTITPAGDTKVTAFSPFAPSAAYSASTNGGSGYFDGSGDYLSVADNSSLEFGSGDLNVEAWIYLTGNPTSYAGAYGAVIASKNSDNSNLGFYLYLTASSTAGFTGISWIQYYSGASSESVARSYTFTQGQWYHVAVSKQSGSVKLFINGVQQGATATFSQTQTDNAAPVTIGGQNFSGGYNYYFPGYLTDARIVKGSAVYTSNFTPPTAPLTAVTNTQLLLNCTNAGIYDNAGKNDIETVGNAQISTSVKKYGTGSMYFDGTGDLLYSAPSIDLSGDFTVEAWLNFSGTTTQSFLCIGDYFSSTGIVFYQAATSRVGAVASGNTAVVTGTVALTTSAFTHVAVVRSGGIMKLYVNGVNNGNSWSSSTTFAGAIRIGRGLYNGSLDASDANGYIDDLRITKGQALYTSNFTPPTQAFPNV